MNGFLYQPFYCEENIWQLCRHPQFQNSEKKVVFISNHKQACPMWHSKAAGQKGGPVVWDYHVILICKNPLWQIWDFDSRLGLPATPDLYLTYSFNRNTEHDFQPLFRVVEPHIFLENFSSDRSHMIRPDHTWSSPPPPWPVIFNGTSTNLKRFIDMDDPFVGTIMDLNHFSAYLHGAKKQGTIAS